MPSFNSVTFVGHLTRNVTTRSVGSTSVSEWGMAANRKYKTASGEQRDDVCFVDCKCWGNAGETVAKYVAKGDALLVSGRLAYEQWDDKNGGGKRSKLLISVDQFQFLGGGKGGQRAGRDDEQPGHDPGGSQASSYDTPAPQDLADADIPF